MRTETIKLYTINELSPEAKEKALDKYRDWNTEYDWYSETIADFTNKLEEEGYHNPRISFSGFGSQGDGASFTCKSIDLTKFSTKLNACLAPVIAEDGISAYIERTSHHYSHEKTVTLYVDWESSEARPTPEQQDALESLERTIEEDRLDWCKKIYKTLREEYDFLTSEECIAGSLEANEIEFMENGTRF